MNVNFGYLGEQTINDTIANFRNKYAEFSAAYTRLKNNRPPANSATYAQWNSLVSRGSTIDGAMKAIVSTALNAAAALKNTFGEVNFGAIPLLPVAVGAAIITGLATMTYYITDAVTFSQKEESRRAAELKAIAYAKLKSGAISQAEYDATVTDIYRAAPTPGLLGDTASIIKWVAIGGAIFLVAPRLLELFGGRK